MSKWSQDNETTKIDRRGKNGQIKNNRGKCKKKKKIEQPGFRLFCSLDEI